MPNTFELIASSTVGAGGAASIDFTSIPSTYTDLCLKVSMRTDRGSMVDPIMITFNSSSTGYSYRSIWSSGSGTPSSFNGSGQSYIDGQYATANNATASTFTNYEMYIPNYAGSNQKSTSYDSAHENNGTEAYLVMMANLWTGTAAISSIKLDPTYGSFVQYSTAYLYGVKNA